MDPAPAGGASLVELDSARFFQQIDDSVRVTAKAQRSACLDQPPGGTDAVAKITLGGGAHAYGRATLTEQDNVPIVDMDGVDSRQVRPEDAFARGQLRRRATFNCQALLNHTGLLSQVHGQRRAVPNALAFLHRIPPRRPIFSGAI